ncbi:hypothetical protein [Streptomyces azureus]|uniref:Uncharacterized protein n=1 Tax=Streptomyces azureus TaxID=146537 RepID=A0A0K8PSH9_STRAJ|nr:hypothetical protein [Streptomyces azureus]GAP50379.1 uncharacterized protein SAZU_5236 [Streptomyces azureus]
MNSKGWGALFGLSFAIALGWGLTGLVEGGCVRRHGGRCGVPDGYGWHFAAVMVAAFSLALLGWTVIRTDDWRPSLGISVGALAALVITLSTGTARGFLILATVEAAVAVGLPLILWRVGRLRGRSSRG